MAYWLLAVLAVATLLGFVATFLSFLWFLKQLVVSPERAGVLGRLRLPLFYS